MPKAHRGLPRKNKPGYGILLHLRCIDKPVSLEAYDSKFSAQLRTLPPRATPPEPQQTDHRVRKTLSFNQVIADLRT